MTSDVIGKSLCEFEGQTTSRGVIVPEVFIKIYEYFTDPSEGLFRLRQDYIFRAKAKNPSEVDKLEVHISLGDYTYLHGISDPHVVAIFFKAVLQCMKEPLCTFKRYKKFKNICKDYLNDE
jgi:hypothetical protein